MKKQAVGIFLIIVGLLLTIPKLWLLAGKIITPIPWLEVGSVILISLGVAILAVIIAEKK